MTINDVGRIGPQDNELEAIKKRNADLQFCLDKEVARVMKLTQQNADLREQIKLLWDAYPNAEWREEFMSPREVEIFGSRLDDLLAIAKAGGA